MGIATSSGVIRDFAGSYYVAVSLSKETEYWSSAIQFHLRKMIWDLDGRPFIGSWTWVKFREELMPGTEPSPMLLKNTEDMRLVACVLYCLWNVPFEYFNGVANKVVFFKGEKRWKIFKSLHSIRICSLLFYLNIFWVLSFIQYHKMLYSSFLYLIWIRMIIAEPIYVTESFNAFTISLNISLELSTVAVT